MTTIECEHVHTHTEEAIGAYWSPEVENSIDTFDEVLVCDACDEVVLEDGCES